MGEAVVKTSSWRLVEVGRVVLFSRGPQTNKLAVIVEIIDHKRVSVCYAVRVGVMTTSPSPAPRRAAFTSEDFEANVLTPSSTCHRSSLKIHQKTRQNTFSGNRYKYPMSVSHIL